MTDKVSQPGGTIGPMLTEPTGEEPWTPVEITMTSATERAAFRKCRRQWFLTVVHRLQTQEDNVNFWLGELVHTGLEAYYKAVKAGRQHLTATARGLDAYEKAYAQAVAETMAGPLGIVWQQAGPVYEDLGKMGFAMLQGYFDREALDPIGDEIVEVEVRRFVPILDPDGNEVGKLAVRTDLVVRRGGTLAAVDHKTAKAKLSPAMLDIDDQLTAETFVVWLELDEWPEEAIYNALLKKMPEPPEVLKTTEKDGRPKLSKRKDAPTTLALYEEEIERLGLDRAQYLDILEALAERDETGQGFYWREATFRTPGQMRAFDENLYQEFRDMVDVAREPARAYPNPSTFACPSCPVKQVCLALMDGSDAGHLIRSNFMVGEPRY